MKPADGIKRLIKQSLLLNPDEHDNTANASQVSASPADLTTFASFSFAYRRGGMEMIEQMCDKALAMSGPRLAGISMHEFLEENNHEDSERTKL
jgi:hypothetical protein